MMMKKYCIVLLLLIGCVSLKAQYNLVPNPSFEIFDTCPDWTGQIYFAPPWDTPQINFTPDYFNACDTSGQHPLNAPDNYLGFQYAHTGVAYADVVTAWFPANHAAWNYREYIEVELTDTLIAGVDYCLRWYVSACDSCWYISNTIGIYFSDTAISYPCPGCPSPLPFTPQFENPLTNNLDDRFGWTEISGTYTATGGEKFILIGNFHDTSSTVATYTGWSNPIANAYNSAVYYIDDVLVTPCDSLASIDFIEIKSSAVKLFPSLADNKIEIFLESEFIKKVKIFSSMGQHVYSESEIYKNQISIDISAILRGVYVVEVTTNKNKYNLKFIKN